MIVTQCFPITLKYNKFLKFLIFQHNSLFHNNVLHVPAFTRTILEHKWELKQKPVKTNEWHKIKLRPRLNAINYRKLEKSVTIHDKYWPFAPVSNNTNITAAHSIMLPVQSWCPAHIPSVRVFALKRQPPRRRERTLYFMMVYWKVLWIDDFAWLFTFTFLGLLIWFVLFFLQRPLHKISTTTTKGEEQLKS